MQDDQADQGQTKITLSDNTTMLADVYIAATGVSPNTSYAPSKLLNHKGYVLTNPGTLRVEDAGERVHAIGDGASYSANYVLDVYAAIPALTANLAKDLWAWELQAANPYGGQEDEIAAVQDVILERPGRIDSQLCPITRRGGVGILFGRPVPSIGVHLLKGHDYRVGQADKVAVNGNNPY